MTLFDFGLLLEIRELSPHFSTELRIVTNLPEVVLLRGGVGAQLGLGGPVSSGPLAAPSSKDEEHTLAHPRHSHVCDTQRGGSCLW